MLKGREVLEQDKLMPTSPEEFENGDFFMKTRHIFSAQSTAEEFKNATIVGHFRFVFQENLDREIS